MNRADPYQPKAEAQERAAELEEYAEYCAECRWNGQRPLSWSEWAWENDTWIRYWLHHS